MKAFINKKVCMCCGTCGGICQDIFFVDYDGTMWALDIELEGEILDMARHAEAICPTYALSIKEEVPIDN